MIAYWTYTRSCELASSADTDMDMDDSAAIMSLARANTCGLALAPARAALEVVEVCLVGLVMLNTLFTKGYCLCSNESARPRFDCALALVVSEPVSADRKDEAADGVCLLVGSSMTVCVYSGRRLGMVNTSSNALKCPAPMMFFTRTASFVRTYSNADKQWLGP
jgi:hypothetical protein